MKSTDRGTHVDVDRRRSAAALRRLVASCRTTCDANLLFVGLEFGVYFTVDGGEHWVQLTGGIPTIQARDLAIHRRERRPRRRHVRPRRLHPRRLHRAARRDAAGARRAAHVSSRCATPTVQRAGQVEAAWGDVATPNPPYGALFTYSVGQAPAAGAKLVLTIADETGKQVRRIELIPTPGCPPRCLGSARVKRRRPQARWTRRRSSGSIWRSRPGPGGPPVAAGRYSAAIGTLTGDAFAQIGDPQSFLVVPLPR